MKRNFTHSAELKTARADQESRPEVTLPYPILVTRKPHA